MDASTKNVNLHDTIVLNTSNGANKPLISLMHYKQNATTKQTVICEDVQFGDHTNSFSIVF